MPSTMRLLKRLALAGILVFAGIWALATFVQPSPREMVVTVPLDGAER